MRKVKNYFLQPNTAANSYIHILKKNLHQSAEKLGLSDSFSFYQDNNPKHNAHSTRAWLSLNCRNLLDTPPQSPDINPIENLWNQLYKNRSSALGMK